MKQLINRVKQISILVLTIFFIGGCENNEASFPKVTAGFTYTVNPATATVTFINISEKSRSYEWNFGDGQSSTEINPIKTFAAGTYTVILKVKNEAGGSDTFESQITIAAPIIPCTTETIDSLSPASLNMTFKTEPVAGSIVSDGASFARVSNPSYDNVVNGSCNVGKIIKEGINPWDNVQIVLGSKLDFSANAGLKIKVFSATAGFKLVLKLEDKSNAGTNTELEVTTTKTNAWEELTFAFGTAQTNKYDKIVLIFDLATKNNNTYYFDDLKVYARTGGGGGSGSAFDDGLLTNGDFESGNNSWIIGVGTSPAPVKTVSSNTFYSVNVTAAGASYDVNVSQKLAIVQGSTYTLTFDAWSDRARTIIAGIGLSGGDFSNKVETVNITTTRTTYTLTLAATNFGASDARVLFDLGAAIGEVNIDNVSLFLKSAGGGTGGSSSGELTTNGGLETGDTSGWVKFVDALGASFTASSSQPKTGSYSGHLVSNFAAGNGGAVDAVVKQANIGIGTIAPNTRVTISFDIRGTVGVGGDVFVQFFSELSGGGVSKSEFLSNGPNPPFTLTSNWTSHTFTVTTGSNVSGGVTVQLKTSCGPVAGCVVDAFFDNVSVKLAN
jgi:hypothetical protein